MDEQIAFLIEKYGKGEQRTPEWFATRSNRITASECTKAFSTATFLQKKELIESKLISKPGGTQQPYACIWGTHFEPIAKQLYQEEKNISVIQDLACVIHQDYEFLGASPDGLILDGEMRGYLLELKCPISRSFEEGSAIPNEYYHQMQMQMECTKLDKCVYLETKFKHVSYSEWKDSDKKKGCYAERPGEIVYCQGNVEEWTSQLEDRLSWTVRYWILEKTRSCIIDKDPQWITDHILEFQQTWNEVLEHRKNGTLPQPKEKGILVL
jgi:putative phage-type endonuclease